MKKMRNGRKGFTLVEIVVVVAIIVILAGAASLGVAATLQQADDTSAELKANNGYNFEAAARNQVESYGVNAVDWATIPKYTPENEALKKKQQMLADGWKESEIIGLEYDASGWHVNAEWDSSLHYGLKDFETYSDWKSKTKEYLDLGYTEAEIQAGTTISDDGNFTMNPVWNKDNHEGLTYEQYVAKKNQTTSGGGGSNPTGSGTVTTSSSSGTRWNQGAGANTPITTSNVKITSSSNSQISSCTITIEDGAIYQYSFNNWKYDIKRVDEKTFVITYKLTGNNATSNPPDTQLEGFQVVFDGNTEGKISVKFD